MQRRGPAVNVTVRKANLWHYVHPRNVRWMNDPAMTRFLTSRVRFSITKACRYYLKHIRAGGLFLAIEVDGRHVGNCGFFGWMGDSAELRIMIGERAAWGLGIGAAAVKEMLGLARQRGVRSVWLNVHPENERARRLYRGCGFADAGETNLPDGTTQVRMLVSLDPEVRP